MSNQHTQGEWELHLGLDYFSIYTNGKTSNYILQDVPFCVDENEEGIANLKLMAAAPKLLGALERLEAHCCVETGKTGQAHADEGQQIRKQVQAAIAAAKGE